MWRVERDARGWTVVDQDGNTRRSLSGLSCITARVMAAELRSAYLKGREDMRGEIFVEMVD